MSERQIRKKFFGKEIIANINNDKNQYKVAGSTKNIQEKTININKSNFVPPAAPKKKVSFLEKLKKGDFAKKHFGSFSSKKINKQTKNNPHTKKFDNYNTNKTKSSIRKYSLKNKGILSELILRSLVKNKSKNDIQQFVIDSLKKPIDDRTNEECKFIKQFIIDSKYMEYLKPPNNLFDQIIDNLLTSLSEVLKYKQYEENILLFKMDDPVDQTYFIIKGKIDIIGFEEYKIELTSFSYIKSIYKMYNNMFDNQSKYLLKKIINTNKKVIEIPMEEIPSLNEFLLKYRCRKYLKEEHQIFDESIEEILEDCLYDRSILNEIGYKDEYQNKIKYKEEMVQKIINILPQSETENAHIEKKYLLFLQQNEDKLIEIKRFRVKKLKELKDGDFLGENTIDESLAIRNCTATTLEETQVAYLDYNEYKELIDKYNERIKNKEAKFLKDSFFFEKISLTYFINNYLDHFKYEIMSHGNNIISQDQRTDYVYFFKEGTIEMCCNKSIAEIIDLIEIMSHKLKNRLEIKQQINNLKKKISVFGEIKKEFLANKTFRLFIMTKTDVLGLESWLCEMPYFYSCKIISQKAGFYKIEYYKVKKLIEDIKSNRELLIKEANHRLEIILKRLLTINKLKIDYYNQFESKYKKQVLEINDLLEVFSPKENTPKINYTSFNNEEFLNSINGGGGCSWYINNNGSNTSLNLYQSRERTSLKNLFKYTQTSMKKSKKKLILHSIMNMTMNKKNIEDQNKSNSNQNHKRKSSMFTYEHFEQLDREKEKRNLLYNSDRHYHIRNNTLPLNNNNLFNMNQSTIRTKTKTTSEKKRGKKTCSIKNEIELVNIIGKKVSEELLLLKTTSNFDPNKTEIKFQKNKNIFPSLLKNQNRTTIYRNQPTLNTLINDTEHNNNNNTISSNNISAFYTVNKELEKKSTLYSVEEPKNNGNNNKNKNNTDEKVKYIQTDTGEIISDNNCYINNINNNCMTERTKNNNNININIDNNIQTNSNDLGLFRKHYKNAVSSLNSNHRKSNIFFKCPSPDEDEITCYCFKGNKYSETHFDKFKKKVYKLLHETVQQPNYFLEPYNKQ